MKTKAFEVKRRNSRDTGYHTEFVEAQNKKQLRSIKEVSSIHERNDLTNEDCPMRIESFGTENLIIEK